VKETVSEEAREDQWGVRSIDKVQHTAYNQSINQADDFGRVILCCKISAL